MQNIWIFLAVFLFNTASAMETTHLLDEANRKKSDQQLYQQAIMAGEERVVLCGYCHGKDGNSVRSYIPNLASQTPEYLINQFEQFARGERENLVMTKLAGILNDDERVNIALYYSQLKAEARQTTQPQLVADGEKLFFQKCSVCHSSDASGNHAMPRLAGQPENYLITTLHGFRDGNTRGSSPMASIASELKDAEITSLAAYLTSRP